MRTSEASAEPAGLSQKAAAGVAWSTVSTAGKQVLSILSLATVARVLGPGAYGVMGMAALLIVFIGIIRDMGTGTAIIQRPAITDRLLSTLFWVNCLFGALLPDASRPRAL
jgi:teichuronic acid exporter